MQRLPSIDPRTAQGRTRELLDAVQAAFGSVPNVARVMANSPAVLESFLAFGAAMKGAQLDGKLHHQVKLLTSETNECEYCQSILTTLAPSAGLTADEVLAGRTGKSGHRRTAAALDFAEAVLDRRGKVSNEQLAAARAAGFDDRELVEIVASVVQGCLTNFLNNVADTELDIPAAAPVAACQQQACSVA